MLLPPDDLDPQARYRSELPALPKERPSGYRPGWQLGDRLQGLGVVALGLVGLLVVYATYAGVLPSGLPPPPQPRGLLVQVPIVNAATCVMPLLAIGSVALIVVGFRRVLDP
ncbi:MAG: hypothetical protein M3069_11705 [Chloroflexota bacterium]|nr:hypothetical protein [Chloroflexota bacterium]